MQYENFFKEVIFILYTLCKDCNTKIPYGNTRCNNCIKKREEYLQSKNKQYNRDRYIRDKMNEDIIRAFYVSSNWKDKRKEIINKYNNECQICKALFKFIPIEDIHHIIPLSKDFSKRLDNDNLIGLCSKCHRNIHYYNIDNRNDLEKYINYLIDNDKFAKTLIK